MKGGIVNINYINIYLSQTFFSLSAYFLVKIFHPSWMNAAQGTGNRCSKKEKGRDANPRPPD
jgi:hypothetical protein